MNERQNKVIGEIQKLEINERKEVLDFFNKSKW